MASKLVKTGKIFRDIQKPLELGSDLEDSIWVECEFADCELSGIHIYSAVFFRCYFEESIFYWANAFQAKFIDCKFKRCDLRGDFNEASFVRCGFENCELGDDNLGGEVKWEGAVAHECVIIGDPLPIVPSHEG
jgi:uncharacterized protein YjbI with pentapeptide repeats